MVAKAAHRLAQVSWRPPLRDQPTNGSGDVQDKGHTALGSITASGKMRNRRDCGDQQREEKRFHWSPAVGRRVTSRAGRRREHATARLVGPAANPDLAVRARGRLLERNKLGAADDPAFPGHGDLVSRLTVIVAAAPLAGRISKTAATDPGIMGKRRRNLRDHA